MKWFSLISLSCICSISSFASSTVSNSQPGIFEERFVTIGGIEQWISIKGDDRDNPVLLFVHGGPGNPLSILSESLYAGWEKDFTLVHYDQRGAGKTYGRNLPVEELTLDILEGNELTLDLLISDGVEVVQYLLDHLEKDQLILTGTSWGSALAISIYQASPNSFKAYVGLSPMIDYQKNIAASYATVLAEARKREDSKALETLSSIGAPPWVNPRNPGRLRRIVRLYETETTSPGPELTWSPQYESEEGRNAYFAGEEFSWVKFVGMKGDGFSNQVNLFESATRFSVPVILIQGEKDLLTTPEITHDYFDQIEAPEKKLLLVPDAGHDPNLVMLRKQLNILRSLK